MRWNLKRIALVTAVAALATQAAAQMSTTDGVVTPAGPINPATLGSTTNDQVFTPITPCRVVDTRNVGGPIGPFSTRNFYFYTVNPAYTWASQGGLSGASGTVCPGTYMPGFAPSAAVATITVTGQAGYGNLIVWQGTNPLAGASTMSYPASGDTSSLTTIPWGARSGVGPGGGVLDFGVYVNAVTATNVVVDIVGYYTQPAGTALDCVVTANTATPVLAGANFSLNAVACAAGYTSTSVNCRTSNFNSVNYASVGANTGGADCQGTNISGGTITMNVSQQCCRVPGH